ncbi:hypothetical protein A9404_06165 [Halothiobacillus diazotrophicus]|uniref:Uncharacterized protein n=1 Tax=Halothiobacillus diazotrophicus TaxID=1860122 RepID=A0A191ZGL1_9GAMM|nr:DUF6531 domain-containing protein [Halothiobacillus diazotrophicus]ANJ67019.1 hypothetical protein A9404_06165 [Halothiobacillus diazotrophicus]
MMNTNNRLRPILLWLALLASVTPLPQAAHACGAGSSGATCGGAGVASLGNSSGTNQGGGNPINVITGNKFEQEVDLPALPGVLGLEIVRYYNSALASPQATGRTIGRGWRLSYETQLYPVRNTLQIMQADGTRIIFVRNAKDPSQCATKDPTNGSVRELPSSEGGGYVWTWADGRKLKFNWQGKLVRITAPTGEFVRLEHNMAGALVKVTDPEGRSLTLHYPKVSSGSPSGSVNPTFDGVHAIDSPVGRFVYTYGSPVPQGFTGDRGLLAANLSAVTLPNGVSRHYLYEDPRHPSFLTGLSVTAKAVDGVAPPSRRIRTWAYDKQGRGILSVLGKPRQLDDKGDVLPGTGIGQVDFAYPSPSKTVLTNSLGQKTVFTHTVIGQENRLLEVRGAGCTGCGTPNRRYGYDKLGRMIDETRLAPEGRPLSSTQTRRDALGRPIEIRQIEYLHGKPQPARPLVRYTYAGEAIEPNQIIRPSVVPGKEFVTHIAYNAVGQPTQVTESGFSPIDAQGHPQPTALTRTTTYTYQTINGRSLLTRIDGPLPDGPKQSPADSDITQLEWDQKSTRLIQIIDPMNRTVRLTYDAQGRPQTITRQFDNEVHRDVMHYTALGQVATLSEEILSPGKHDVLVERTRHAGFDAENQLTQIIWPDQSRTRIDYSAAGRPKPIPLADGQVLRFLSQPPGNTQPPTGKISTSAKVITSAQKLDTTWGKPGTAAQNHVLQFKADGKTAERRFDDFGRVVAIKDPGQTWQTARYDAADRLIEKTDPLGNRSQAQYDLAGRLIRMLRTAAGANEPEQTVQLHWVGPNLTEETVRNGGAHGPLLHRTQRSYTLWGQLASEQVTIPTLDQTHPVRMQRHLYYSSTGQLLSQTLPNGQRLAYRYYAANAQHPDVEGQLAEIDLINWPAWLDPLLTRLPEANQPKTVLVHFSPNVDPQPAGNSDATALPPEPQPGMALRAPGQQFDAAGLPHRLNTDKGNLQLIWNAAGQLTAVNDATGQSLARYTYDAQGRRASSRTSEGITYFFYAGTQLLATATQSPEGHTRITGEYVYAGYRPIAWLKPPSAPNNLTELLAAIGLKFPATAYALNTDHRGAVLTVTALNHNGVQQSPLWQSHINAWGKASPEGNTQFDPHLRLVNQYADTNTGLSYNLARYYDPITGRYISPDPAGIADSIDSKTPQNLKLDTTAYVSGQPLLYFDPDGAAKITYYLIDSTPNRILSATPGTVNTQGRWAFWIRGTKDGGNLLYDAGGSFFAQSNLYQDKALFNKTSPDNVYANWLDSTMSTFAPKGTDLVRDFINYYLYDMISPPSFTLNISDQHAAALIADVLNAGNVHSKYWCSSSKPQLLYPSVTLANHGPLYPGGKKGQNDTSTGAVVPQGQDTVQCTEAMTPNRRFDRLKAAIEMQETKGKSCAKTGCPTNTSNFLGEVSKRNHNPKQPASYGKTQFTAATLIDEVLISSAPPVKLPASNSKKPLRALLHPRYSKRELVILGLEDANGNDTGLIRRLNQAKIRISAVKNWIGNNIYATTNIIKIPQPTLYNFARDTGLGWREINVAPPATANYSITRQYYVRIIRYLKLQNLINPYIRQSGGSSKTAWSSIKANPSDYKKIKKLLSELGMSERGLNPYLTVKMWNEGWNALYNAAIFTDNDLKKWMLTHSNSIFKNMHNFNTVSGLRMRRMIARYHDQRPKETEETIVRRYANFHNGYGSTISHTSYSNSVVKYWKQADCINIDTTRFSLDPKRTP